MAIKHTVSVRTLAEYACAVGNLRPGMNMAERMRQGREGHLAIQNMLPCGWEAEAAISAELETQGIILQIQGRADAVCIDGGVVHVAEIKTTQRNPLEILSEDHPEHWAQAQIYAWMFCRREGVTGAELKLIYADAAGVRRDFRRETDFAALEQAVQGYAQGYAQFMAAGDRWKQESMPTLLQLAFPFADYRAGQREMARYVYTAMCQGQRTMIEAPTGIGKTAASLFGALKALGEQKITAVFYLTARTTGRRAAENALQLMRASGLKLRSVTITAKEKICFLTKPDCGLCRYADGYFDRRQEVLKEALFQERFDRETIERIARENEICPFELSLDLSDMADVVICDYNYVFDPRVRLKRRFERKSKTGLLIDEAHNLPERAREMFSARLSGQTIAALMENSRALYGDNDPFAEPLAQLLAALTREEAEYECEREAPEDAVQAARVFSELAEELSCTDEDLRSAAYEAAWFVRVARQFDEEVYRVLIRPEENKRIEIKLWCFAPEKHLDRCFARVGGVALFSATLTPAAHYAAMLAVPDRQAWLTLESPFPEENLYVARLPVSVRLRDRDASMEQVACILHALMDTHIGNYMVCFPSHAYLEQAFSYYRMRFPADHALRQESRMSEQKRADFIAAFQERPAFSTMAFVVLGGVFAEGVDLPDDRLSGVAVISTGIPQPSQESELLRDLHDDGMEGGYDTAYTYPGFRRVLQAAGRVIRTDMDRGVVLLIDARFAAEKYETLVPAHWHVHKITALSALTRNLKQFWTQTHAKGVEKQV